MKRKPSFLQWLKSKGACGEGMAYTVKSKSFTNFLSALRPAWMDWLASSLNGHIPRKAVTEIRRAANAAYKANWRFGNALYFANDILPWRDGYCAQWRAERANLKCPRHPKYRALRKPRSNCKRCRYIWELRP